MSMSVDEQRKAIRRILDGEAATLVVSRANAADAVEFYDTLDPSLQERLTLVCDDGQPVRAAKHVCCGCGCQPDEPCCRWFDAALSDGCPNGDEEQRQRYEDWCAYVERCYAEEK